MRQVSPLPTSGAGIQIPYGKHGTHQHLPKEHVEPEQPEGEAGEHAEEVVRAAPPPGMGLRIDRSA